MSLFHLHAQIISRGSGRSLVGACSYRCGEVLTNEYDGRSFDFTHKSHIAYSDVMLPPNAPAEYKDHGKLCNSIEMEEKSSRAQLAREINACFPLGMTLQQEIEIAQEYCQKFFVDQGMCVIFAIHEEPGNPHVHILLSMRPLSEDGAWEQKSTQVILAARTTEEGREERAFSADEFKKHENEGWEKQYQYYEGRQKIWLTKEEAAERELKQVNRYPKRDTIPNPTSEYWNAKDRIYEWREGWASEVNKKLLSLGREDTIDHRSYAEQGIDKVATVHMGHAATQLEREGITTTIGDLNRSIQSHNRLIDNIRDELKDLITYVKERATSLIEKTANMLESIRSRYIGNNYNLIQMETYKENLEISLNKDDFKNRIVTAYDQMQHYNHKMKEIKAQIKDLAKEKSALSPLSLAKRSEIEGKIVILQQTIEEIIDYKQSIYMDYGFETDREIRREYAAYTKMQSIYNNVSAKIDTIKERMEEDKTGFFKELSPVNRDERPELEQKCLGCREIYEKAVLSSLKKEYGEGFNPKDYDESRARADRLFSYEEKHQKMSLLKEEHEKDRHDIRRTHN